MRTALLFLVMLPFLAFGQERSVSTYDVIAKGFRAGHVTTERKRVERDGKSLIRCEVTTDVHVNLILYRYSCAAHDVTYSDDSGVIEFDIQSSKNGRSVRAHGVLKDAVFHLDIVENGAKRSVDIPRDSYDLVAIEGPEQFLKTPGESRKFRVLSLDDLCVTERRYTYVKRDSVKVGADKADCRVVDFADEFKSGRRWFTMDDLGLCVFRQEGRDKAGAYTLRMTSNKPQPLPVAVVK